tara:strand:- start:33 stop:512 length:480 start_codon:yes stop_codon:yes gene_type:complete
MAYSLIASTTLTSSSSEIVVDSIPAKNFLQIVFYGKQTGSGNFNARFQFNDDSGSNYCSIETQDYGTTYNQINDTNTENLSGTRTSGGLMGVYQVSNIDGKHSVGFSNAMAANTGAGGITGKQVAFCWNDTDQINKVRMYIDGSSDYAADSFLLIYGTD